MGWSGEGLGTVQVYRKCCGREGKKGRKISCGHCWRLLGLWAYGIFSPCGFNNKSLSKWQISPSYNFEKMAKLVPGLLILDKFELHVHLFLKILLPDPALILVFILVLKLKLAMIGWKKILASKKNGGLGVSSLFSLNRALLYKWIWRFISNGASLWSWLITAIHGVNEPINSEHKSSRVGNGEATSFWDDIWAVDSPLKRLFPRLYLLESNKCCSVAVKLRDSSLISSFRRPPWGGIEDAQLRLLEGTISPVLLSQSSDRWTWRLESPSDFSVKSALNIFAWKVCLDKLPTRLNLSLRGLDIPSILCPICFVAGESSAHLLFSCDLARQLSSKVSRWWEVDSQDFHSYDDWLSLFKNLRFSKRLKHIFEGVWVLRWTVLIDSSLVCWTVLIEIVSLKTILVVILLSRLMKSRRTCLIRNVLTILNEISDCCGLKLLDVIMKYQKIIPSLSEWALIIAMI
nr:RNA-directed DNA polymerase, eukaryota [Tanacetum cinerariifolium]